MTSLEWRTSTFRSHRLLRRDALFWSLIVETFATRCWWWTRRLRRRVRSAGAAWCAVAGIAAIASFTTPNAVLTSSTTATRLTSPRIVPLISLLYNDLARWPHHPPLVQIVVFVMRHSMCWQLAVTWNAPIRIFLEGSRCTSQILWWWAVFEAWTFSRSSSLKRWSWLENKLTDLLSDSLKPQLANSHLNRNYWSRLKMKSFWLEQVQNHCTW